MITKEEIERDIKKLGEINNSKKVNIITLQENIERERAEINQWQDFVLDDNNKFDKERLKAGIKRKQEGIKGIERTIEAERQEIEDNLFKIQHLKEKIWLQEIGGKMVFYVDGKEVKREGQDGD